MTPLNEALYSLLENPNIVGKKRPRCYWRDGGDVAQAIKIFTNASGKWKIPDDHKESLYAVEEYFKNEAEQYKEFLLELSEKMALGEPKSCVLDVHGMASEYEFPHDHQKDFIAALELLEKVWSSLKLSVEKQVTDEVGGNAVYEVITNTRADCETLIYDLTTQIAQSTDDTQSTPLTTMLVFLRNMLIVLIRDFILYIRHLEKVARIAAESAANPNRFASLNAELKNADHACDLFVLIIGYWKLIVQKPPDYRNNMEAKLESISTSVSYTMFVGCWDLGSAEFLQRTQKTYMHAHVDMLGKRHLLRIVANIDPQAAIYHMIIVANEQNGRDENNHDHKEAFFVPGSTWDKVTTPQPTLLNPAFRLRKFKNAEQENKDILKAMPEIWFDLSIKKKSTEVINSMTMLLDGFHNSDALKILLATSQLR